jgi:hypothetical protein
MSDEKQVWFCVHCQTVGAVVYDAEVSNCHVQDLVTEDHEIRSPECTATIHDHLRLVSVVELVKPLPVWSRAEIAQQLMIVGGS